MATYIDLTVDLLDLNGVSIGTPQYCRFESANGTLANLQAISFVPNRAGVAAEVVLRSAATPAELFRITLERSQPFSARDTINFAPAGITVQGEGDPSIVGWMAATQSVPDATFEEFLAGNPDASPKEIWEAGFVAGTRITHILLTGEAP